MFYQIKKDIRDGWDVYYEKNGKKIRKKDCPGLPEFMKKAIENNSTIMVAGHQGVVKRYTPAQLGVVEFPTPSKNFNPRTGKYEGYQSFDEALKAAQEAIEKSDSPIRELKIDYHTDFLKTLKDNTWYVVLTTTNPYYIFPADGEKDVYYKSGTSMIRTIWAQNGKPVILSPNEIDWDSFIKMKKIIPETGLGFHYLAYEWKTGKMFFTTMPSEKYNSDIILLDVDWYRVKEIKKRKKLADYINSCRKI
jgi:hypothetical protein